MRSLKATFIVSAMSVSPVVAQPMFLQEVSPSYLARTGGEEGFHFDMGDINGDLIPDVVFGERLTSGMAIYTAIGNGLGEFDLDPANAEWQAVPGGPFDAREVHEIRLLDLDNDGDLDVLIKGTAVAPCLSLVSLLNDGSGNLTLLHDECFFDFVTDARFPGIATGDFNQDGFVDIASSKRVGDGQGGEMNLGNVFLNDGTGALIHFGPFDSPIVGRAIAAGDMNNDGLDDLVLGEFSEFSPGSARIAIISGTGGGEFGSASLFTTTDFGAGSVGLTDFDNDNDLDVIGLMLIGNPDPKGPWERLRLLENDGLGFLSPAPEGGVYPIEGQTGAALHLADLNADGNDDVLLATSNPPCRGDSLSVSLGTGDGRLAPVQRYRVDAFFLRKIATADLDRDGILDVLTATPTSPIPLLASDFAVFPESPFGQPGMATELVDLNGDGLDDIIGDDGSLRIGVSTGNDVIFRDLLGASVGGYVVGDFDQDGFPDIVIRDDCTLRFYLNDGSALFEPIHISEMGTCSFSMGVPLDLDQDGDLDIAGWGLDELDQFSLIAFLNNGTGLFSHQVLPSFPGSTGDFDSFFAADFNSDGTPDFLAHRGDDGTPHVFLCQGGLNYVDAWAFPPGFVTSVGDVNGDDIEDVLFKTALHAPPEIWIGDGDGSFTFLSTIAPFIQHQLFENAPYRATMIDADADGDLDIVGTMLNDNDIGSSHQIAILVANQGNGSFLTPGGAYQYRLVGVGTTAAAPVFGDIDGDGDADIAYPGSSDTVLLFNQTITAPCPGDATGDGSVDFDDLNLVLANWNLAVAPGSSGDVTGDGQVDFDDLNVVLGLWGAACP